MKEIQPRETVIYGGAFNPPTLAHQAILQACIDYAEPRGADVWLLPSASRKDKAIDGTYERRLQLCEALTQDVLRRTVSVVVFTLELDREQSTETYDTVCELEDYFPDRRFTWVFGADSVATMGEWKQGLWMLKELDMLIVERPGYSAGSLGPRAVRLAVETSDVSSTDLRQKMANGETYEDIVSPTVSALLAR